jgi:2-keto-3-deoxy-L-rhamnonate aldolase RhmA
MRGRVGTCTTTLAKDPVIRDNPVKAALAAGGRAYGAMVFEFFSPGLPQICKNAGAEFVLFDMEHTGLGFETLKTQIALCRGLDIVPMARVPRGEYHFIARALDVGAMGVMVPMVGSAEEAAHIVSCTRYPPIGRRGAAFGFAHDDYGSGDVRAKIEALRLGHFDLTNFLGIPGGFQDARFVAAVDRIIAACETSHKAAAFIATDEAWVREYANKGFRLFAYGLDQLMLQTALRQGLDLLRAANREGAPR